jgi:hypothetical protein
MENELENTTPRRKMYVVKETNKGVYLWKVPGHGFISDGDGHFFMIEGTEHDPVIIKALRDGVKSEFGITEGEAVFFVGNRIVSDEEYETQKARHRAGLHPDIWDNAGVESELTRGIARR